MFIDEIPLNSKISIRHKDTLFETKVNCIQIGKNIHYCMLEPVIVNDVAMRFPLEETQVEWERPEGGIFKFTPEKIANLQVKNIDYLVIQCNQDTKMFNRRKEYRSEFSVEADVKLGSSPKTYKCFLHDVSRSGMSFKIRLLDKPVATEGMKVEVSFEDEKKGNTYKLKGNIKRIIDLDPFLFMGIELVNPSIPWLALVNSVERQSLKLRRMQKKE